MKTHWIISHFVSEPGAQLGVASLLSYSTTDVDTKIKDVVSGRK